MPSTATWVRILGLGLIAAAIGGGQALAVDPQIVEAQSGEWLVAPENGAPGCLVTFTKEQAIGGYAVTGAEKTCATALPALAEAYAWNFSGDGGLIIIDATRKVLARFEEQEGSPWRSGGGNPLLLLHPPQGVDRVPTPAGMSGSWSMRRPDGETLCTVTLSAGKDRQENGKIATTGTCAATVAKLKLEYWQVNAFDLTLMSGDGSTLAFTMGADGNFEKVREQGGKPLLFIRQRP